MADIAVLADIETFLVIHDTGSLDRTVAGGVRAQSSWRNPYWSSTPDWARKVFDNLSEFLARPTFWNGIMVGDGQAPYVDPATGKTVYPLPPALVQANNPSQTGVSLQSDNWHYVSDPKGWRLDRAGDAWFDWLYANVINSRGDHLYFQFEGDRQYVYTNRLSGSGDSGGSVTISRYGVLSAPIVNTKNIINQPLGGTGYFDIWINGSVRITGAGVLTAPDVYARGTQVSIQGHTHSYLTQTTADTLYAAISHTHSSEIATAITAHEAETDPHPQYQTQAESDARYFPSSVVNYGRTDFLVPDSSGFVWITHGLGHTPTAAIAQYDGDPSLSAHWGGSEGLATVHQLTSTQFKMKLHYSNDGTAITGSGLSTAGFTYVGFYWAVFG